MPTVVIRQASKADIESYSDMPDKPTIKALCMDLDGQIVALGGVALVKGRWLGFADFKPEARVWKMHIMRAARRFIDSARREGIRYIYVEADPCERAAVRWIKSLGFEADPRTSYLYRWKAN